MAIPRSLKLPPQLDEQLDAILELSFIDLHEELKGLQPPLQEILLERLISRVKKDPERYRQESVDAWHNLSVHSSYLNRKDLELQLLRIAIELHPECADLQADLLQVYYMQISCRELAQKQWEILNNDSVVPKVDRELNWRYWVFGALYHARTLNDTATAQALMREGLEKVPGSAKSDILRYFEETFIDLSPTPDFDIVQKALEEGIRKGWDCSYTLALRLAVIHQKLALQAPGQDYRSHLTEALHWLSVAEATFTNDPNHPIAPVYRARVNILMALGNYREAIDYMTALCTEDARSRHDNNLRMQLILACQREGEPELWRRILSKDDKPSGPPLEAEDLDEDGDEE